MRNFGRRKDDILADSIAKGLVFHLIRLERADVDPEHVMDCAKVQAHQAPQGVQDAIKALLEYYCGGKK